MLEQDDALRSSSTDVEEAFVGLKKSLLDSQQALTNERKIWDNKIKVAEEAR